MWSVLNIASSKMEGLFVCLESLSSSLSLSIGPSSGSSGNQKASPDSSGGVW